MHEVDDFFSLPFSKYLKFCCFGQIPAYFELNFPVDNASMNLIETENRNEREGKVSKL